MVALRDNLRTMTIDAKGSSVQIEVITAAPQQEPILANLFELYAHDFSEFHDIELSENGRFGYKNLSLYWSEPSRFPLLIKVDGRLAGFVLVKQGSEISGDAKTWDIAEFFVLPGYRRRGVGTVTAHQVWRQFPGAWEVRVMESNGAARSFWERAIAAFTGGSVPSVRVEKDGVPWCVFSFDSCAADARLRN